MESELDREELGQVLQAMRVFLPDIGDEQFQSLLAAQDKLSAAGFLEAVWGVVRLQEEKGIDLSDAIDEYQNLLEENEKLAREQSSLKGKRDELQKAYQQILSDIAAAKKELEAILGKIGEEKEGLAAFVAQAEQEKKRINYELEKFRQKAGVTEKDVKMAGSLKTKVKRNGFGLETMLDLVKEFAPYRDARERLAKALEKEGSLTQRISSLKKEVKEQEDALASSIAQLTSQKTQEENELKRLKSVCQQWDSNLRHLQADVAEEQRLRHFMVRYGSGSGLLECLASWKQIRFLRCDNPGCEPFGGINHFWTEKQATKCPHCGSGPVYYDEELYKFLNLEMRPFKLILG
jgi:predicted  nucleic acid-binding Zn-ribbon protein